MSSEKRFGVLAAVLVLLSVPTAPAADPRPSLPAPAPPAAADPNYNGYDEAELVERQHEWTLYLADRLLREQRPAKGDPVVRKMALLGIDEVLHYAGVPADSTAVAEFARARLELAADEIESTTPVRDGAVIWKLYNHGFVVRTRSVTLAFDIVRGWWAWNGSRDFDAAMARIVAQCDILFISHEHGDHAENWVKERFLAHGKPIVAPPGVFADEPRILRPARRSDLRERIPLRGGRVVETVVCPGYQGDVLNNVYVVNTPEGLSFAHTGDLHQGNSTPIAMYDWIDTIGATWPVDVLMVNNWTTRLPRTVDGFSPKRVLTGHENEVGHGIEKRMPYFLSYDRTAGHEQRTVVMTWGESYWYRR